MSRLSLEARLVKKNQRKIHGNANTVVPRNKNGSQGQECKATNQEKATANQAGVGSVCSAHLLLCETSSWFSGNRACNTLIKDFYYVVDSQVSQPIT